MQSGIDGGPQLQLPERFALSQNYPNPFNPSTTIQIDIPTAGLVTMAVYNLLGQEILRLVDRELQPGKYQFIWNGLDEGGNSVPSGIYLYRVRINGNEFAKTRKMILLH
ncbi:MAG: T9SS type A sorting domain-containing protein [Candidatus Marinimicrobia bacterium]|nr:T9SS type A sorting domain-containing protein [Candidatus Neomarinimicrobiota bacterium]